MSLLEATQEFLILTERAFPMLKSITRHSQIQRTRTPTTMALRITGRLSTGIRGLTTELWFTTSPMLLRSIPTMMA